MDAVEIVKKISNHYLVENDIAIQMQLGFPYLEKKSDMLYMSFKPHKEVYQKGKIDFYTPQYKIVFVFPFDHVVYFDTIKSDTIPVSSQKVKTRLQASNNSSIRY